jgi:hypothetical protein
MNRTPVLQLVHPGVSFRPARRYEAGAAHG